MVYENGLPKDSVAYVCVAYVCTIEYCNNNLVMDPNWGTCHSN